MRDNTLLSRLNGDNVHRYHHATLDFYDDAGQMLKATIPDADELPEIVKVASHAGHDLELPQYALAMQDGGETLKRYPMTDAGNVWLSTMYFGAHRDKLPQEAQKVAATHLSAGCAAYGIEFPEELEGLVDHGLKSNLINVEGLQVEAIKIAFEREPVEYAIARADGSRYLPLGNPEEIKHALTYFEECSHQLEPRERREFAVKVASAAKPLALPLGEKVASQSRPEWNPEAAAHLTVRHQILRETEGAGEGCEVLTKMASAVGAVEPALFADALEEFDTLWGLKRHWGRHVSDPWETCFAKQAADKNDDCERIVVDEVITDSRALKRLMAEGYRLVETALGPSTAHALMQDPMGAFKSLNHDEQRIVARLAAHSHQ